MFGDFPRVLRSGKHGDSTSASQLLIVPILDLTGWRSFMKHRYSRVETDWITKSAWVRYSFPQSCHFNSFFSRFLQSHVHLSSRPQWRKKPYFLPQQSQFVRRRSATKRCQGVESRPMILTCSTTLDLWSGYTKFSVSRCRESGTDEVFESNAEMEGNSCLLVQVVVMARRCDSSHRCCP